MTTVVTKIIGTLGGADYSDWQSWEDACPVDLTAVDQVWRGTQQNCVVTTSTAATLVSIAGTTTDSTRYLEMTTATGASFQDNVNVNSNAPRYNESNGAAINTTRPYGTIVSNACNYTRVSKLQFLVNAANANGVNMAAGGGVTPNCDVNACIIESSFSGNTSGSGGPFSIYGSGQMVRNSVIVMRASSQNFICKIQNGSKAVNCTFAVPSDFTVATYAFVGAYAAPTLINCAFFGTTFLWSGGISPNFTTCISQDGMPGQTGVTQTPYSAAFVNSVDATRDYRIPSTSPLKDAGTSNPNSTISISGYIRGNFGTNYDVGAWEYQAPAATAAFSRGRAVNRGRAGNSLSRGTLVN